VFEKAMRAQKAWSQVLNDRFAAVAEALQRHHKINFKKSA